MSTRPALSCVCALYMISIQVLQSNSRTSTHWRLDVNEEKVVQSNSRTSTHWRLDVNEEKVVQVKPGPGEEDLQEDEAPVEEAAFDILSSTVYWKGTGSWKRSHSIYEDVCEECRDNFPLPDTGVVFDVLQNNGRPEPGGGGKRKVPQDPTTSRSSGDSASGGTAAGQGSSNTSGNSGKPVSLECGKPANFTYYDHLIGIANRHNHPNAPEPQVAVIFNHKRVPELDLESLEKKLRKAKAERPRSIHLYNQLGNYWRIKGHTQRSIECFRKALALSPNNAEVLLDLAQVLFHLQYLDDAIFLARRSLEVHPPDQNAWLQHFTLGEILKAYGHYQEAAYHLRHCLELKPNFSPAMATLQEMESLPSSPVHVYTLLIIIFLVLGVLMGVLSSLEGGEEDRETGSGGKPSRQFNRPLKVGLSRPPNGVRTAKNKAHNGAWCNDCKMAEKVENLTLTVKIPPLLVVSNRLPFVLKKDPKTGKYTRHNSAGGLVTAVAPVMIECNGLWVGWPGIQVAEGEDLVIPETEGGLSPEQIIAVRVSPDLFEKYYNGFSNGTLWPLFHSMPDRAVFNLDTWDRFINLCKTTRIRSENPLEDLVVDFFRNDEWQGNSPDLSISLILFIDIQLCTCVKPGIAFKFKNSEGTRHSSPYSSSLHAYCQVNKIFAEEVMVGLRKLCQQDTAESPIVWIHDYHLMVAANTIRTAALEEGLTCRIGFFLHIPFPCYDIFRILPWGDQILQGILDCDLVGFHIDDYCRNFIECCHRLLGFRVDFESKLIEVGGGRMVQVKPLPIGIPYQKFENMAQIAPRGIQGNEKIILGVDRLDYTKGLVHRLRSIERFFEKYPQHIGNVTLLQVSVPSRTDVKEYKMLKDEIDMEVGRINGRFSTPIWSPIRYIYGSLPHKELVAFYRDAAIALVNPLRDGMNLVAKEFVACQVWEPGTLILSPFAGAGETMSEALMVNPYELENVADKLHDAVMMSIEERRVRMYHLQKRERRMDCDAWLRDFLKAMSTNGSEGDANHHSMKPLTVSDFEKDLSAHLEDSEKIVMLLDYDGTLAPIVMDPKVALMRPEMAQVLRRLNNHPDVTIAILSGRNIEEMKHMIDIEGIIYAGNHGLEILHPDGSVFTHPLCKQFMTDTEKIMQELQSNCCTGGAWVEQKDMMMTFHYRKVPNEQRKELVTKARSIIEGNGFKALKGDMCLEAWPPVEWDKGQASIHILRTTFGVDWFTRAKIIYVGDDELDEPAMQMLKGIGLTFRVTSGAAIDYQTSAQHRLASTDAVLTLLKFVERHCRDRAMPGLRLSRNRKSSDGSPTSSRPSTPTISMATELNLSGYTGTGGERTRSPSFTRKTSDSTAPHPYHVATLPEETSTKGT
ncbi:unnamed protein product [Cyprideis torosa]|uniref:Uncharacterized protein n=1 Tax=Cyprideis torosa TaxID=163714 RepID=A0A7R8W2A9_9CRUS|nr:unnamed protein product [Cyprideis torosa]CAG0881639.1 unnamed protein product [Cyprideis torosa]